MDKFDFAVKLLKLQDAHLDEICELASTNEVVTYDELANLNTKYRELCDAVEVEYSANLKKQIRKLRGVLYLDDQS